MNIFLNPELARAYGRKGGLKRQYTDEQLDSVAHLSVRRAAAELGCSPWTVQTYRKRIQDRST